MISRPPVAESRLASARASSAGRWNEALVADPHRRRGFSDRDQ
jgi:hypothetical protein